MAMWHSYMDLEAFIGKWLIVTFLPLAEGGGPAGNIPFPTDARSRNDNPTGLLELYVHDTRRSSWFTQIWFFFFKSFLICENRAWSSARFERKKKKESLRNDNLTGQTEQQGGEDRPNEAKPRLPRRFQPHLTLPLQLRSHLEKGSQALKLNVRSS